MTSKMRVKFQVRHKLPYEPVHVSNAAQNESVTYP